MADYIPQNDDEFTLWAINFLAYLNANLAKWGLVAGDVADLTAADTDWNSTWGSYKTSVTTTAGKRVDKDNSRHTPATGYEALLRARAQFIQNHPATTDGDRASMGLTVPDSSPTAIVVTTHKPIAVIDTSTHFQHTINFADESTPSDKAKPKGVFGAQIWLKILPTGTPAPTGPAGFELIATDTKTPYTYPFESEDAGKVAYYYLRWQMKTGGVGPWSSLANGTITG